MLAQQLVRPATTCDISTFTPTGYEPGYAYPLVVWLHRSGCSERHLPKVMQHISSQNFVAVAPRGLACKDPQQGCDWLQQEDQIARADDVVQQAVELAQSRYNIHSRRVFLVGHGSGGTMAARLAMQRPGRFAGIASIGGQLPRAKRPLRHLKELRDLPFMLAAARDCHRYPQNAVCDDLRMLHSAGCSVALRQYPGDDDLTTVMLADVNRWIMERVCGSTT